MTLYIYELSLGQTAKYKPVRHADAVFRLLIVAESELDARSLSIEREHGGQFPGKNIDTAHFWGPTLSINQEFIQCRLIGKSYESEAKILCAVEIH